VLDPGYHDISKALRSVTLLRNAAIVALLLYLGLAAFIYLKQRSLLYLPTNFNPPPENLGLAGVDEVRLSSAGGESLVAWFAPASNGQPTILFLHGNAGEIADRTDRWRAYVSRGFGVMFLSYRGYGGSTGSPTEEGLIADAMAAHQWLRERNTPASRIMLVGESLGSGVAVQLAAGAEVGALALEAPFTSAADIAASIYWWLPVRLLMKDQFDSMAAIPKVRAPVMIVHGDSDELIPVDHGRRLYEAAAHPAELHVVPGGTHQGIINDDTWEREMSFFESIARK
jgi:hypothetical protein